MCQNNQANKQQNGEDFVLPFFSPPQQSVLSHYDMSAGLPQPFFYYAAEWEMLIFLSTATFF